ncbi:hypothetical protein JX265_012613 [Neoarthrinium moseri]|uniref:RRM domain-containing protein n=1 Tax=Neoarthrinium moseri TaxID=1658444 RepID=A0A9P9WAH3_9PEZI|nr:hypothetical protein JX265_012613 [Neoarthrinium moseri]
MAKFNFTHSNSIHTCDRQQRQHKMAESGTWRDASDWRSPSSTPKPQKPKTERNTASWNRDRPSGESDSHKRQPIVALAERSRPEDLRVHRPARQRDGAEAGKAIEEGRRVYLGNLLYNTTPDGVEEFLNANGFSAFENVHISVDPFTGRNPGYCFVQFPDSDTAEKAIATLDGKLMGERAVRCRPCQPKGDVRQASRWPHEDRASTASNRWGDWNASKPGEDRAGARLPGKGGPNDALKHFQVSKAQEEGRQLYVGGLPRMLDQAENEVEMRSIFKDFEIDGVSKRVSPREAGDGRRNFCFVDFATPEQAQAAIDAMKGANLGMISPQGDWFSTVNKNLAWITDGLRNWVVGPHVTFGAADPSQTNAGGAALTSSFMTAEVHDQYGHDNV